MKPAGKQNDTFNIIFAASCFIIPLGLMLLACILKVPVLAIIGGIGLLITMFVALSAS